MHDLYDLLTRSDQKSPEELAMVQTVIIGFLIGAVLSWAFRVWALIPLTMVIFLSVTCCYLYEGQPILSALGDGFVVALTPQAGYVFGLIISGVLLALRSPRKSPVNRFAPRNPPSGA